MLRVLRTSVLTLVAACGAHETLAAPTAASRPTLRWTAPSCLAYSPTARAFACLDFSLESDEWPGEVRAMDFEHWKPVRDVAWSGHKAIALVGPTVSSSVAIADKAHDGSRTIRRARTEQDALAEIDRAGYRAAVTRVGPLPSGRWVAVGGVWLRFETSFHDGDASSYAIGSLRLRCAPPAVDPGGAEATGKELLEEHRGASAAAFTTPGAATLVVGVLKEGGGEGAGYVRTTYVPIEPATACAADTTKTGHGSPGVDGDAPARSASERPMRGRRTNPRTHAPSARRQ